MVLYGCLSYTGIQLKGHGVETEAFKKRRTKETFLSDLFQVKWYRPHFLLSRRNAV